jgi:exopolysaccharide production protein ExoY
VRPGLTGAWQIGGRSDVTFARRVDLDTTYVSTRNFRADMVILAKTVPAVLKRQGSR